MHPRTLGRPTVLTYDIHSLDRHRDRVKISRPVLVNSILAVVAIGAIVGGYLLIANPFGSNGSAAASQLTSTVQQGTVSSSITASGSITPLSEVDANFAVSGTIATVNTSLGATVTAGDVIGTLDTTDLAKALTRANTTLSNAKSSLADAKTNLTSAQAADAASAGGGNQTNSAKQQVTSAQSTVNDAADAVATAQANLASATLKAPITGLVVAVNGSVGGSASAGSSSPSSSSGTSSFVTIADVSQLTMTANIAEADIASVTVGQVASVTFPAMTATTATAKVTAISPIATASNSVVTYATTITLDSIPKGLRLGQTADVTITTASSAAASLYVPTAAITTAADGTSTVKVVSAAGTTTTKTVKLGIVGDTGTEVTSGLSLGQTVVIGTVAATTGTGTGTGTGTRGGFGGGGFTGGTPVFGGQGGGK
jgi:macrolide-specific efflux system membrane fusion protein